MGLHIPACDIKNVAWSSCILGQFTYPKDVLPSSSCNIFDIYIRQDDKSKSAFVTHAICQKKFVILVVIVIEASTYGNLSTFCKKKFLYRMRPVFRASLWPDQWSYSVPLGIKWKIWTLSFHWYPLVSCGFSGLDTTASQSQGFFPKVENAENWPTLLSGETQLFGNFFSNGCHS